MTFPCKKIIISLLFVAIKVSFAQLYDYYQPGSFIGTSAGIFRISLDNFESIYTNRWGPIYSAAGGVRFYKGYYFVSKYYEFKKYGKEGVHPETGYNLINARWEEKIITLGFRVHPPIVKRTNSYYGFGIALYQVDEKPNLSAFTAKFGTPETGWGNGIYLELGMEYFVLRKAALFFETDISSGGLRGRTGFEAFSVGGFCFALGLHVYPF